VPAINGEKRKKLACDKKQCNNRRLPEQLRMKCAAEQEQHLEHGRDDDVCDKSGAPDIDARINAALDQERADDINNRTEQRQQQIRRRIHEHLKGEKSKIQRGDRIFNSGGACGKLFGVEPTEKERRWFQLHLSTAVVLTFAAGILLFLNCCKVFHNFRYYTYGWPGPFYYPGGFQESIRYELGPFEPAILFLNVVFSLFLLFVVAFVCEARIRGMRFWWIVLNLIVICILGTIGLISLTVVAQPFIGHYQPK
jgi:hypothetical protein